MLVVGVAPHEPFKMNRLFALDRKDVSPHGNSKTVMATNHHNYSAYAVRDYPLELERVGTMNSAIRWSESP
jgi:hypothetical protein